MSRKFACLVSLGLLLALGLGGCGGSGPSSDSSSATAGSAADRALLQATVHSAALGLAGVAVSGSTLDQTITRNYVHSVTFLADNSGYFFSYDRTTNVCVAHWKNRDWEGQDKTAYQDSRGTYVIQELSKIANTADAKGFLVYYWNNPTTGKEERKLGYIEVIPGTNVYIGSGIYIP